MASERCNFHPLYLGVAEEFRESKCQVCQLVYKYCTISGRPMPDEDAVHLFQYNHDSVFSIAPEADVDNRLLLVPLTPSLYRHGHGLRVDSKLTSIERLSQWLDVCNQHHHGRCHSFTNCVRPRFPITVIDVQNWCLTTGPVERYLALSYVWGKMGLRFMSLDSNLTELHKKQSLWKHRGLIAKTILDAMHITKILAERYLWVDSLCIVQDSEESKSQQIHQMDIIFAKAYLTLVDVDGRNADHGLPGTNEACPRNSAQRFINMLRNLPLSTVHPIWPAQSSWFSRGWTYQEMLLSRRMLLFSEHGLAWNCHFMSSSEYLQGLEESSNGATPWHTSLSLEMHSWPSFENYSALVESYNSRHLTFVEDALYASSGIISALCPDYGGIYFGLPEMYFDLALSWQPLAKVLRRISSQGMIFPSWSWVGWHGPVDVDNARDHYIYPDHIVPTDEPVDRAQCYRIDPVCTWYKTRDQHKERSAINIAYRRYRLSYLEPDFCPPKGWSKELQVPGDEDTVVWRHPEAKDRRFSHPVPTGEEDLPEIPQSSAKDWDPYLFTVTNRIFLRTGLLIPRNRRPLLCQLIDAECRIVWPHNNE